MLQLIAKFQFKKGTGGFKLIKGLVLCLCLLCLCSCSNDGRLVKKFIARVNAKEVNSASKYIYPADHASLYFFNQEVLKKTPNLLLKLTEKKNVTIEGQKAVVVKIECKNVSQFFVNYMQNLNMLDENNCIVDTIFVKETGNGDKITFGWTKIQGENLYLASLDEKQSNVSSLNIRSGKSEQSDIIGKLTMDNKIVIDEYSENPDWVQCFTIDHTCNIVQGYIKKNPALTKDSLFFSLGIFEGLSVIIALVILIAILVPIFLLRGVIGAIFGFGIWGVLFGIALILFLIYAIYQLLENILFELFLINLPY